MNFLFSVQPSRIHTRLTCEQNEPKIGSPWSTARFASLRPTPDKHEKPGSVATSSAVSLNFWKQTSRHRLGTQVRNSAVSCEQQSDQKARKADSRTLSSHASWILNTRTCATCSRVVFGLLPLLPTYKSAGKQSFSDCSPWVPRHLGLPLQVAAPCGRWRMPSFVAISSPHELYGNA